MNEGGWGDLQRVDGELTELGRNGSIQLVAFQESDHKVTCHYLLPIATKMWFWLLRQRKHASTYKPLSWLLLAPLRALINMVIEFSFWNKESTRCFDIQVSQ